MHVNRTASYRRSHEGPLRVHQTMEALVGGMSETVKYSENGLVPTNRIVVAQQTFVVLIPDL